MTKGTEVIHRFLQRAAADNTFLVSNGEHLIAGNEVIAEWHPEWLQITAANQGLERESCKDQLVHAILSRLAATQERRVDGEPLPPRKSN